MIGNVVSHYRILEHLGGILIFCISRLDQDDPVEVGGNLEMKVLKEMNELQDFENDNWSWGSV